MSDDLPGRTCITEAQVGALREYWPGLPSWRPQSTGWGSANVTFYVDDERRYVLKVYGGKDPNQLSFEHRVLERLSVTSLPFAVSCPCRTVSGDTMASLPNADADWTLQAAVYTVVPGEPIPRGDDRCTRCVGAALGELHAALAVVPLTKDDAVLPGWGDLDHIHTSIPDWRNLPEALEMPADVAELTRRVIEMVDGDAGRLRGLLPLQVVHGDYVESNVLFERDRVSAVIDFEFATFDLRAFDLAASLYHFCLPTWQDTPRWNIIASFLRGYLSKAALLPNEIDALPALLRWQRLSCLVYWTGLHRQGMATYDSLVDATKENLRLEEWLRRYGDALVMKSHVWRNEVSP